MADIIEHVFEAYNYKGVKEKAYAWGHVLFRHELVALLSHGQQFTVVYGLQVDRHLDYSTACRKLGEALLHQCKLKQ